MYYLLYYLQHDMFGFVNENVNGFYILVNFIKNFLLSIKRKLEYRSDNVNNYKTSELCVNSFLHSSLCVFSMVSKYNFLSCVHSCITTHHNHVVRLCCTSPFWQCITLTVLFLNDPLCVSIIKHLFLIKVKFEETVAELLVFLLKNYFFLL